MLSNELRYSDSLGNSIRFSTALDCCVDARFEGISMKFVARGCETYHLGQRAFAVEQNQFLLSNHSGKSSVTVGRGEPTHGLCVTLSPELLERVALDHDVQARSSINWMRSTNFSHQLHAQLDSPLTKRLSRLSANRFSPEELEEELVNLSSDLIADQLGHHRSWTGLPFAKMTTRNAAFESLLRVKAHIDAHPQVSHNLDDLAAYAALSKYRLIRLFKAAFGVSPVRYAAERKMEWAAAELLTAETVSEVAYDAGYADRAAFSRAFRKRCQTTPVSFLQK